MTDSNRSKTIAASPHEEALGECLQLGGNPPNFGHHVGLEIPLSIVLFLCQAR